MKMYDRKVFKFDKASVLCQCCDKGYEVDITTERDGFRNIKCPYCGFEQIVWIELRVITVPVAINPSKRT